MKTARESEQLEKKRLRDRRAQNARRARQEARVQELEEQVRQCRDHHHEADIRNLRAALEALRLENSNLRIQEAATRSLFLERAPEVRLIAEREWTHETPAITSTAGNTPEDDNEPAGGAIAFLPWSQLPLHIPHGIRISTVLPWLMYPAVVLPVPDLPTGADILYGSLENPLANSIHVALSTSKSGSLSEGVRLGLGYVLYVWSKWLFDPTPARFERLPHYMHPTELQKTQAHSPLIDMAFWPQVRDNFIRHFEDSDELLFALRVFIPELIVPRSMLDPMLEPDFNYPGQLRIRPQCIEIFNKLESWAPPAAFHRKYPEIVKGTEFEQSAAESSPESTRSDGTDRSWATSHTAGHS